MATDTITLPTAADVDAAAKRLAGVAIRTPLINSPVLDARLGARVFLKAETLAAHRLVQVPRRLQQDFLDPAGQEGQRRGGLFVRQSRAGRGARGGSSATCRR